MFNVTLSTQSKNLTESFCKTTASIHQIQCRASIKTCSKYFCKVRAISREQSVVSWGCDFTRNFSFYVMFDLIWSCQSVNRNTNRSTWLWCIDRRLDIIAESLVLKDPTIANYLLKVSMNPKTTSLWHYVMSIDFLTTPSTNALLTSLSSIIIPFRPDIFLTVQKVISLLLSSYMKTLILKEMNSKVFYSSTRRT